jgi:DNA mismatch repair protein MutS
MQESANILNNATRSSLILLDEVGRGTATFDGISIAWAIAEFIHDTIGARTLFATHYHELNELASRHERIRNFRVQVEEMSGKIIFTHKISEGRADHSFGIYVAEMAGLPKNVTSRAAEIMRSLEAGQAQEKLIPGEVVKTDRIIPARNGSIAHADEKRNGDAGQLSIFEIRDDKLREMIRGIDVNNLTPIQALQTLADISAAAKK